MTQFFLRRLLLLLPVLAGILFTTFAIARLIPGDPCYVALGERATEEQCNAYRERLGLNDNIGVQFTRYLGNVVRGDFGVSLKTSRPVSDVIVERLPMTLELTIGAMLFSTTFGILLGIISAVRRNSVLDVVTMIGANIGVSMPVFWLGLMLAYLFALTLKGTPLWIPPSGRLTSGLSIPPLTETFQLDGLAGFPLAAVTFASNMYTLNALLTGNVKVWTDAAWHLILPSVAVGTIPLSIIARMTRSSLLEVLNQDYIRTARAKGLMQRTVIFRHALRNAMLPIVTIVGLQVGGLLSGAVLTETIFGLPGIGTWLITSILARDYSVVQAATVVIAIIYVMVNMLVDASYAFLDPRIRLQ
ncbi:MAG: ABC transporter permease [Chloroflexi bacterium]|nr:ABC transporter permease [Chloroflexota bacterium]